MVDLTFPKSFLLQGEGECGELRSRTKCLRRLEQPLKALQGAIDHGKRGGGDRFGASVMSVSLAAGGAVMLLPAPARTCAGLVRARDRAVLRASLCAHWLAAQQLTQKLVVGASQSGVLAVFGMHEKTPFQGLPSGTVTAAGGYFQCMPRGRGLSIVVAFCRRSAKKDQRRSALQTAVGGYWFSLHLPKQSRGDVEGLRITRRSPDRSTSSVLPQPWS